MEVDGVKKTPYNSSRYLIYGYKYSRVGNTYVLLKKDTIVATVGPHWPGAVFTSFLIVFAAYLNIYIICINLTIHRVYLITFVCILCLVTEISLYGCALSDPGIVLPNTKDPLCAEERMALFDSSNYICDVCEVVQPIGTAHCTYCDVCIEKLDHHCPWIGKCVGRRNMRWFQLLIGSVVVYLIEFIIVGLVLR